VLCNLLCLWIVNFLGLALIPCRNSQYSADKLVFSIAYLSELVLIYIEITR
jgi:hypothetical protein